jgi:hypothetical protein
VFEKDFKLKNYPLNKIINSYKSQSIVIVYARTSSGLSIPMSAQNAIKLTTEEPPDGAPGIAIDIMTANML